MGRAERAATLLSPGWLGDFCPFRVGLGATRDEEARRVSSAMPRPFFASGTVVGRRFTAGRERRRRRDAITGDGRQLIAVCLSRRVGELSA